MESERTISSVGRRAPTSLRLRRARAIDADEAAAVLRASISTLCVADHGNDAEFLAGWLANKTPGNVRAWIEGPGRFVVAEEHGQILGVGAVVPSGEITLNYVLPEARFRGVSKAVLAALEAHLRTQGHTHATLTSTRTAHRFYRAMGYVDAGGMHAGDGLTAYPMFKDLSVPPPSDPPPLVNPSGG